jgi:cytochrome c-type biogenesis protein CcmE
MLTPGRKLAIGGVVIAGAAAYMAYLGASSSWRYYVTAEECLGSADSLIGSGIRVSGKVLPGTLRIGANRRQASFSLAGTHGQLPVECSGIVPDNLVEDMEVVVEGRLEHRDLLRGDKVLARCASKYRAENAAEPSYTVVSPGQGNRR